MVDPRKDLSRISRAGEGPSKSSFVSLIVVLVAAMAVTLVADINKVNTTATFTHDFIIIYY
jgi:hypothetical protein